MSKIQSLVERVNQASGYVADATNTVRVHIDSILGSVPVNTSTSKNPGPPETLDQAIEQLESELMNLRNEYNRLDESTPSPPGQGRTRL